MKELHEVPARHETIQKETFDFYQRNKAALTSMSVSYTCGFIQGYGIACEGALKIGETVQFLVLPMKLRNLFMDLIYNSLLTIRFISLMTLLVVVKGCCRFIRLLIV